MSDSFVDSILNTGVNSNVRKNELKPKFGKNPVIMGLGLSTTSSFREDLFKSRIKTADELLYEKRITNQEAKKRQMEAAFKYYGYLKEVGHYSQEEYDGVMLSFANSIGVEYVPINGSIIK